MLARIFKLLIYPMLIVFPVGLRFNPSGRRSGQTWSSAAFYSMVGAYWYAVRSGVWIYGFAVLHRRHSTNQENRLTCMTINLIVAVLHAINIGLHTGGFAVPGAPLVLSVSV
jgi:hypothetical protein